MTLPDLLGRFDTTNRSLVVVNRTEPDPIYDMLVDTFGDDGVDVYETDGGHQLPTSPDESDVVLEELLDEGHAGTIRETLERSDVVVDDELTRGDTDERELDGTDGVPERNGTDEDPERNGTDEDPERNGTDEGPERDGAEESVENLALLVENETIVAASPIEKLVNAILLVNSDLYVTGARGIETLDLPAVITGLDDAVFTLRGYPESNRQKLLLITISRFIERVAWEAGSGTLRSSFQRLSRLDEEVGTRRVYETVPTVGVDTHVYGVPDRVPTDLDVTVHAGRSTDFTDTWFVVFRPDDGPSSTDASDDLRRGVKGGVALLAVEREDRVWQGIWTFDTERIQRINGHIRRNL